MKKRHAIETVVEKAPNLVEMFGSSAFLYANERAVSDSNAVLTYAELDLYSSRLAQVLAGRGISNEDRVGVYLDRGVESVVALLGILKAGAVCLPIDTRLSGAQRDAILSHSKIKVLLTLPGWSNRFSDTAFEIIEWGRAPTLITHDNGQSHPVEPASTASILYTMDCSGVLRGGVLEHKDLALFATAKAQLGISQGDRVAHITGISFDSLNLFDSIYLDVWSTLAVGAEIVIFPRTDSVFAAELKSRLERMRITIMVAPVTVINDILSEDPGAFASLRALHTEGDYTTGNLASENEQGELEVVERDDDQVRILGRRVSLSQVEKALRQSSEVENVRVVTQGEADSKRLVALLVPTGENTSLKALRRFLRERIPNHLIPSEFMILSQLPIKRESEGEAEFLSEALSAKLQQVTEYVRPRNGIERYLVSLWEDFLPAERISVLDDFFSLGGHSLLAARICHFIERDLGLVLEFEAVIENSVLRDLANTIMKARTDNRPRKSCCP